MPKQQQQKTKGKCVNKDASILTCIFFLGDVSKYQEGLPVSCCRLDFGSFSFPDKDDWAYWFLIKLEKVPLIPQD